MKKIIGFAFAIVMCAGVVFAAEKKPAAKSGKSSSSSSSSSSMKMYVQLGMGGGGAVAPTSSESMYDEFDCYGSYMTAGVFNIQPTFGFYPIKKNDRLAFEGSLFMDFGSVDYHYSDNDVTVLYNCIMPTFAAKYTLLTDGIFSLYTGLGFGISFQNIKYEGLKSTVVGFDVILNYGGLFQIRKNMSVYGELTAGLGTFLGWNLDAGIRYNIN